MTTFATARVWTALSGVVAGILYSHHQLPVALPPIAIVVGLLCVGSRRRRGVRMAGIFFLCVGLAALRPVPPTDDFPVWGGRLAASYRDALAAALDAAPPRPAGLLAGLTIGDTSGIDYWTTEMFRRSGLAHLVAVSGSNVAMVLGAIAVVTTRLPLLVRGAAGAIGLLAYVAVVGPEPSVLRAAGMGFVGLIAYVSGRQAMSLNSLGIAVIVVLALNPALLFSVGLQLSVAATLGIVLWARSLETRLRRLPAVVRAPMAITLAAQLGVAPLLIITFERISLVAPVANLLAAPAVPPATLLGLGAGVAGLIAPPVADVVARLAAPFAQWILWVSDETGAWSWASADVPARWGWVLAAPVVIAMMVIAVRTVRPPGYVVEHGGMAMGAPRPQRERSPFERGVRVEGSRRGMDGAGLGRASR